MQFFRALFDLRRVSSTSSLDFAMCSCSTLLVCTHICGWIETPAEVHASTCLSRSLPTFVGSMSMHILFPLFLAETPSRWFRTKYCWLRFAILHPFDYVFVYIVIYNIYKYIYTYVHLISCLVDTKHTCNAGIVILVGRGSHDIPIRPLSACVAPFRPQDPNPSIPQKLWLLGVECPAGCSFICLPKLFAIKVGASIITKVDVKVL